MTRTLASADEPFQMLLGKTSMIPTRPAHVTFPGRIGSFIRVFLEIVKVGEQPGGKARNRKSDSNYATVRGKIPPFSASGREPRETGGSMRFFSLLAVGLFISSCA